MAESSDTESEFFAGLDYGGGDEAPAEPAAEAAAPEKAVEASAQPETSQATDTAAAATTVTKVDDKATTAKADAATSASAVPNLARDYVPIAKHLEEKGERRRLSDEVRRLSQELEAFKNPPAPKPAAPDFAQDPRGYVDHTVKAALEQLETGTKKATQTAEQAAAAAEHSNFVRALDNAQQQFSSKTPDYQDALGHLRTIRFNEIMMLNPGITEEQAYDVIGREELQLSANLMRSGRNPAEVAYSLAKARGYTPKQLQAAAAALPGNVTALLPNLPQQKQLPPDQTLGTGTGTPGNAADVDNADGDPFDAAYKEMFGGRRRA